MTDLDRFCAGWVLLLALVAVVRLLGPMIIAHLLARAVRRLCRSDRHVA